MTFNFPADRSTLSLWDIACHLTGQNVTDEKPINETRDKLVELAEAVSACILRVQFHADTDFDFLLGFMPDFRHARVDTDWRKLDHVTVARGDWARYEAKSAATETVSPADAEQVESTLVEPQPDHVLTMLEIIVNGESIDWDYWAGKMPRWTAYQAVRLMAALDPTKHPGLSFKRNETAGDAKKLATRLETLAASHGLAEASPLEWLRWADKHNEPVHEGCRGAVIRHATQNGERVTIEALGWMIVAQDAYLAAEPAPDARASDGMRRTIALAMRLHGWPPDRIEGVIPQIVGMAGAGRITVHRADTGTEKPDATAIAAKPFAYWLTAQDAQRVLTALCPAVRLYALPEAAECIAKRVYPKDHIGEYSLKASLIADMRKAVETGELPTNERRRDGEVMLNECAVDEWLARERRPYRLGVAAQSEHEQAEMERAGRLTIEQIAKMLERETSIDAARWESTIVDAVKAGALPLKNPRNPADSLPYRVPGNLRVFYDRVDVADVDRWLDDKPGWGVTYRFMQEARAFAVVATANVPASKAAAPDETGLSKRGRQIRAIEAIADILGFERLKIPTGGKKMIRESCRSEYIELFGTGNEPFNDAWKDATKAGRVRMADHEKFARR